MTHEAVGWTVAAGYTAVTLGAWWVGNALIKAVKVHGDHGRALMFVGLFWPVAIDAGPFRTVACKACGK
jgi:hypothetical protein